MFSFNKLWFYVSLCSLCFFCTANTSSALEGDVWLEISETNISANQAFTVEINIDPGDKQLASFDLIFNFDSRFCELDLDKGANGVQIGRDLSNSLTGSNSIEVTEGQIKISGSGDTIDSDILNIAIIYLKTNDRFICDKYALFSVNMLNSSNESGFPLSLGSSTRAWIANATCPIATFWPLFMPAILSNESKLQN